MGGFLLTRKQKEILPYGILSAAAVRSVLEKKKNRFKGEI